MLEGRQFLDGFSGVALCHAQFIHALNVEPELGARSEEVGERSAVCVQARNLFEVTACLRRTGGLRFDLSVKG